MSRFFLCLILLCFKISFGQESLPDTLKVPTQEEVKDGPYYQLQAKRSKSPAQSLEFLKKALAARTAKQDDNWVADVRVNMAAALFNLGTTTQGFTELLTAEKLYKTTANIGGRADVLSLMAGFYERNRAFAEAEKYYKNALSLYELNTDKRSAATVALSLADIDLKKNQAKSALNHLAYAQKQFEAADDKNGVAITYVKLAEVYRRQKNYSKGEQLILRSALPMFRSTGYLAGRIGCFEALAKIYQSQKRYSEAKWFFIQQNTQARSLNDQEAVITSLINLGNVKIAIGDYSLARRDFKEAEMLAQKRNDLFLLAAVKNAYADLYQKMGNLAGEKGAISSSEDLTDSMNNLFSARAESAKMARIKTEHVHLKKPPTTKPEGFSKSDIYLIIKIVAMAIAILCFLLIILNRIK